MSDDVKALKQPATFMGLSERVEHEIEVAFWEMKARMDPTQTQYINNGERYAFKMAVRAMFHRLRGE